MGSVLWGNCAEPHGENCPPGLQGAVFPAIATPLALIGPSETIAGAGKTALLGAGQRTVVILCMMILSMMILSMVICSIMILSTIICSIIILSMMILSMMILNDSFMMILS